MISAGWKVEKIQHLLSFSSCLSSWNACFLGFLLLLTKVIIICVFTAIAPPIFTNSYFTAPWLHWLGFDSFFIIAIVKILTGQATNKNSIQHLQGTSSDIEKKSWISRKNSCWMNFISDHNSCTIFRTNSSYWSKRQRFIDPIRRSIFHTFFSRFEFMKM